MTALQEKFIEEYIKCRKGAEAARRAGYSVHTARTQASRLLTNADIMKEVQDRTKANAMDLDEALSRLADIGRADFGEYMADDGAVDLAAMKRDGVTHMIRKVKRKERTGTTDAGVAWHEVDTEIELHDAKDAQKFIADLHKRGATGREDDPMHVKVIEGPRDVR